MAEGKLHHRRSIRLKDYDYSQDGAYYVTICSHERANLFGTIEAENIVLSDAGEIVLQEWEQTAISRSNVELDAFIIMPNHFHCILCILNEPEKLTNPPSVGAWRENPSSPNTSIKFGLSSSVGAQRAAPLQKPRGVTPNNVTPKSLGAIVRAFKSAVSRRINLLRDTPAAPVWQKNYWERIIRDETELNNTRQYIALNPIKWHEDEFYKD